MIPGKCCLSCQYRPPSLPLIVSIWQRSLQSAVPCKKRGGGGGHGDCGGATHSWPRPNVPCLLQLSYCICTGIDAKSCVRTYFFRSLYEQLVSEGPQEVFVEKRVHLLKCQIVQLERQVRKPYKGSATIDIIAPYIQG